MIELKPNKIMIQIGTNTGKDIFRDLVKKYNPSLVLLIEPNQRLIDTIKINYKDIQNVHIINKAINTNNNDVKLYLPAQNKHYGSKGENGHIYKHGQFSMLPMNDWGDKNNMIEITASSITFEQLCNKFNICKIHYCICVLQNFIRIPNHKSFAV